MSILCLLYDFHKTAAISLNSINGPNSELDSIHYNYQGALSTNTTVSVVTGGTTARSVKRRDTGRTAGFGFPLAARDDSLLHNVQISPSQPAGSIQWVPGAPGGKRPCREANHSLPYVAEVNNGGAILSLSHTSSC
jgi:hypothetical protein